MLQRLGVIMRYTGLRADQALNIKRRDIDLENARLTVTAGKSRAEKAEQRTIPISRHLVNELTSWIGPYRPGDWLFPARGKVGAESRAPVEPGFFTLAWEAATAAGQAREIAWKPESREHARPEHAFRAAFQAHMRALGIMDEVIDALVGHHGRSTRGKHYAGNETLWERMEDAVKLLPAIDWGSAQDGKVVQLRARRKAPLVKQAS